MRCHHIAAAAAVMPPRQRAAVQPFVSGHNQANNSGNLGVMVL